MADKIVTPAKPHDRLAESRKAYLFQPGVSGNPGGMPKAAREAKRLATECAPEAIERLKHWMRSDDAKESIPACLALLDRGLGKVKDLPDDEDSIANVPTKDLLDMAIARAKELAGNGN